MDSRNQMKIKKFAIQIESKHAENRKYRQVRDHCHYTGEYRGAAHGICNIKYSVPKEIPIVFHHRSKYYLSFYHKINNGTI